MCSVRPNRWPAAVRRYSPEFNLIPPVNTGEDFSWVFIDANLDSGINIYAFYWGWIFAALR